MLYGVCMYQTIVVFASRIIINQFSLHPLVYYPYRILSGQMSNFINGSIQTDSHFSLYCFIHLPTIFTIHNFHLPGFSITPFPFTPPIFPVLITAFVLFDSETLSYPILKLYPWSLPLNNPSPLPPCPSVNSSFAINSYSIPFQPALHFLLKPYLHPSSSSYIHSLPLLPMRIHNLSPVAWTPTPQFCGLIGFGCGCSAGAQLQVVSS